MYCYILLTFCTHNLYIKKIKHTLDLFWFYFTHKSRHFHSEAQDWSGHFPTHYVLAHSLQWMLWGQLSSKVMALRNFNFWMSFQNSQHDKLSDHSSIVRHGSPCIWSMFSRAGLRLKISKSLLICDWCGTNDLQVCSFSKTQTLKAFIFPISPWLLPTYPLPAGKYVTLCIILFCELRAIFVRYALRNF